MHQFVINLVRPRKYAATPAADLPETALLLLSLLAGKQYFNV